MQVITQDATALFHTRTPEQAMDLVESEVHGLTEKEALRRMSQWGLNIIPTGRQASALEILWRQINNPLIWVLIGSGLLAVFIDPEDGIKNGLVIISVVAINTLIGFVQEFKAGKAIEALHRMVPDKAVALRDGVWSEVPAANLVPGDVVRLASGDKVPADMRLLTIKSLRVDEAALTGESLPVEKSLDPVDSSATIADQTCMVFASSLVSYGTGTGIVVRTGARTEIGKISELMSVAVSLETPLTRQLRGVAHWLTLLISAVAVIILAVGTWRSMAEGGLSLIPALKETLIFSIALAVGAIPEGLPAIVTIALAIGVRRMAQRKAIVRNLPSVETLGSTTVICSDKTGTLTKNEMTVTTLATPDGQLFSLSGVGYSVEGRLQQSGQSVHEIPANVIQLLNCGILCNQARLDIDHGRCRVIGDPTEGALLVAGEKLRLRQDTLAQEWPRSDLIPFESENQMMATLHRTESGGMVLIKGSPEIVLSRCQDLTPQGVSAVLELVTQMASDGLRVLAFARQTRLSAEGPFSFEDLGYQFSFLGLQGMIDPPREEAIDSISLCHQAGIEVKMITGDHHETAQAIGKQLGILEPGTTAVRGLELAQMGDEQMRQAARSSNVFARVAPEHKLRLVKALQQLGSIAAMTGDGVNDAPALKQANIGVAMGITGTSVSKEAADIVLMDDNFASIAAAVEEGRRVYDNLVKSLAFVLPTNLGLAFILIYAVLFFPFENGELVVPMLPTQLLWINLVAAVALALPLAFEAKEDDIMRRPPRDVNEPLIGGFVLVRTFLAASLMTAGAVIMFKTILGENLAAGIPMVLATAKAQTMAVTTVIFFQIFYMLNCRSLKRSVFSIGLWSNWTVYVGIAVVLGLQAAFIYSPAFQTVFATGPLDGLDLATAALIGFLITPAIALEKWWRSRAETGVVRRS